MTFYGVRNTKLYDDTTFSLYRINGDVWIETDCAYSVPEGPCCLKAAGSRLFFGKDDSTYEFKRNAGSNSFNWLYHYTDVYGTFVDACALGEQAEESRVLSRSSVQTDGSNTYVVTSTGLYHLGNETVLLESLSGLNISNISPTADGQSLNITFGSGSGRYSNSYRATKISGSGSEPGGDANHPEYTVITDTHGYPWGADYRATFDLGDNTPSYATEKFHEKIHPTKASLILRGNHDVGCFYTQNQIEGMNIQVYYDTRNNIRAYGLDSAIGQNSWKIPHKQIKQLIQQLQANNNHVIILTHIPLFEWNSNIDLGGSYNSAEWKKWGNNKDGSLIPMLKVLRDYHYKKSGSCTLAGETISYDFTKKTGDVIGCFCGHVHSSIKCYYYGLYMESFDTNGADQFHYNRKNNPGLYPPVLNKIKIDLINKKVNGNDYGGLSEQNPDKLIPISIDNPGNTSFEYGKAASGPYTFYAGGTSYPKFYDKTYVGYTSSQTNGILERKDFEDYFYLENGSVSLQGAGVTASHIRFDAAGKLRYYRAVSDSQYQPIPEYDATQVRFESNHLIWTFQNGKLQSVLPKYVSGSLLGKNGYSIEFNSNGYAYRICKDGVPQTGLSNTENWINVYNLRIFWSGMQDTTDIFSIENTPQIGVDGPMSSTSKINLGRSTASGENKLAGTSGLFVRIQGQDGSYWIHDGRLTALTDENLNYTY